MIHAVRSSPILERKTFLPNIKAAVKWTRQSSKRAARNKDAKSRLKTLYKRAVSSGESATAEVVESAYDKAAAKGIIHRNKAARKKSKRAKAMRRATAAPAKPAKGKAKK